MNERTLQNAGFARLAADLCGFGRRAHAARSRRTCLARPERRPNRPDKKKGRPQK